jgi:methenyltetrahydromethanopterin cyclohydrolase
MISVNELALEIFDNLANYSEDFNVAYHELDNGAKIVDCGVCQFLAGMQQDGLLLRSVWGVLER